MFIQPCIQRLIKEPINKLGNGHSNATNVRVKSTVMSPLLKFLHTPVRTNKQIKRVEINNIAPV